MGKYVNGELRCRITFTDLYVEDGDDVMDALFPEGYEGEMLDVHINVTKEVEED